MQTLTLYFRVGNWGGGYSIGGMGQEWLSRVGCMVGVVGGAGR